MNKTLTLLLFISCNSYGMQAPCHNSGTKKFIQKCTDKIAATNQNISREKVTHSFDKITFNNPNGFRGFVKLLRSTATALNTAIDMDYYLVPDTESICVEAFRELSDEERGDLLFHFNCEAFKNEKTE
jgi:hypothetical protein